jgi:hypothetical protein
MAGRAAEDEYEPVVSALGSEFTVIDILRELHVEPLPAVSWAVGSAVRDRYVELHGDAPMKALRAKTNGPGSHCFAIYPWVFREEALAIVEQVIAEIDAVRLMQPGLF